MDSPSRTFSQVSDILTPDIASQQGNESSNFNYYPGMIVRIKLKNFQTYSKIEIRTFPKMNVIQGPNGTGKSTFLCAVVIGLGGKPEIIGRSSLLKDYVKRDCSKATIEIELYGGSKNYIIKRVIYSDKKTSDWYLQGKQVDFKRIEEVNNKFNININNLCQILPQDRVQDFSKMNKCQLLDATQKAVGDIQMYDWFQELKAARKNNQDQEVRLKDLSKEKGDAEACLAHMEPDVEVFRKRQTEKKDLANMKKKMDWILFADKKKEWVILNENLQQLTNVFEEEKRELKAAMNDYKNEKKTEDNLNKQVQTIKAKFSQVKLDSKETKKKLLKAKDKILHAEREYKDILNSENEKGSQINEIKQQIEESKKMIGDKSEESEIAKINDLKTSIERISSRLSALRPKELNIEDKRSHLNQEINHHKRILEKYLNVKKKKLELLSEMRDAYSAYNWLEQNRDKFSRPIHGPMFLDINVTDPNKAACVERSINYRDLIAFVCEDSNDMTKLLKTLRQESNLKINAIHSAPPEVSTKAVYKSNIALDCLRQFGFTNYLIDLVEAPEAVLKYLCKSYNFHNIPTGSATVGQHLERIPSAIRSFFSDTESYRINQSRFTGDRITSVNSITGANLLASSVNHKLINTTQQKLNQLQMSMDNLNQQAVNISEEKRNIEVELNNTRSEKLAHSKILECVRSNKRRVRVLEDNLKEILSTKVDKEKEEKKLKQIKEECYKELINLSKTAASNLNLESLASNNLSIAQIKSDIMASKLSQTEQKCTALQNRCRENKNKLENFKANCDSLKTEIKNLLAIAKQGTDGLDICDPEFDKSYPSFATLPDNQEELQELITEKETGMRFYKKSLKDDILVQYKKQQDHVAKLQKTFDQLQNHVQNKYQKITSLKDKWLAKLTPLLASVDESFGKSLSFLKCSGEVMLDTGADPEAYENYGLVIKVKFRNENELQALDPFTQSGGERSLTTAVFLLSLQNIIKVPFRFVDEINQGMDAFNEYRVNFLLMCAVAKDPKSQYFLITPKHFGANRMTTNVTMLTIYSGDLSQNVDLNVSVDENQKDDDEDDDDDTPFSVDMYLAKLNVRPLL